MKTRQDKIKEHNILFNSGNNYILIPATIRVISANKDPFRKNTYLNHPRKKNRIF